MKIVLAHGTFDLLHPGHIAYLEYAKQQGDYLIVALASDEITIYRKGPTRPIQTFVDRKKVIEALRCVDECVKTLRPTKDSGYNLIATMQAIKPQVFVSSYAEFTDNFAKEIEDAAVTFVLAPVFDGGTTSKIIEKVVLRHA